MKWFVYCLLVLLGLFSKASYADHCSSLTVFGSKSWQPLSYVNKKTHQAEGIGYDLIKYIAKDLNVLIQTKPVIPWTRGLSSLKEGKIDLAVAIYFSEERTADLIYSDPYYTNEARIFTKTDGKLEFSDINDLLKYSGGLFAGGSYGDEFDKFIERNKPSVERVHHKDQLTGMLLLGRIDYFVLDLWDGVSFLKQKGLESQIKILDVPVSSPNVYFATSKLSHCKKLLPYINKSIAQAKANGVLDAIIEKHTTKSVVQ